MQAHAGDAGVFIRSMATRGHLGGLARATSDVALVLDAAGNDVVLIETVGVGQDEVDIVRTADVSIVTLVPGTGDDVQALKAGIMEIADIFVVNKADREGADRTGGVDRGHAGAADVRAGRVAAAVLRTEATTGAGVRELVGGHRARSARTRAPMHRATRRRARAEFRLRELLGAALPAARGAATCSAPGEFDADARPHRGARVSTTVLDASRERSMSRTRAAGAARGASARARRHEARSITSASRSGSLAEALARSTGTRSGSTVDSARRRRLASACGAHFVCPADGRDGVKLELLGGDGGRLADRRVTGEAGRRACTTSRCRSATSGTALVAS